MLSVRESLAKNRGGKGRIVLAASWLIYCQGINLALATNSFTNTPKASAAVPIPSLPHYMCFI